MSIITKLFRYLYSRADKKYEYNGFIILTLILSLIRDFFNIFNNTIMLTSLIGKSEDSLAYSLYDANILKANILMNALLIITIIHLLLKQRIGIFLFYATEIAGILFILLYGATGVERPIASMCLVSLLFCLRRKGKSGWKIVFSPRTKSNDENAIISTDKNVPADSSKQSKADDTTEPLISYIDEKETGADMPSNSASTALQTNAETPVEKATNEKQEEPIERNGEISKGTRWSKNHAFALCGVCLIVVVLWVIYLLFPRPLDKRFDDANEKFSSGNVSEALVELENLADKDNYLPAKKRLAELYLFIDSVPLDSAKGMKYLIESAKEDEKSSYALLWVYMGHRFKGKTFRDLKKADQYADQCIRDSMNVPYATFVKGCAANERDDNYVAYYYWKKAADMGDPDACNNLGWLFYYGEIGNVDYTRALEYFEKVLSIEEKDEYALYHLGVMYLYGQGVEKDYSKAMEFLSLAAEEGDEDAQRLLTEIEINE